MSGLEELQTGEALARLLIALLGGSLVGLERERARASSASRKVDIPGLRSFGLIGLYGGLTGLVADGLSVGEPGWAVAVLSFTGFLVLFASYTIARYVIHAGTGFTTNAVMLVTFMLGLLAGAGRLIEAASLSVMVTLLLAAKEPLERLVPAITYREFLALLEVGVLAVVLAPLVKAYSRPVYGVDPYKVYIFFIIVLAMSFASYAAARALGVRGLVYSALLGSLVSSEAAINGVTRLAVDVEPVEARRRLVRSATAIIVGVLQVKGVFISAVALYIFGGRDAVAPYAPHLTLAAAAALLVIVAAFKAAPSEGRVIAPESPLSWGSALKVAAAYLVLTLAVRLAIDSGLASAAPIIAALGGLVNATATILSVASLVGEIGARVSVASLLAAIAAASASKPFYAETKGLGPAVADVVAVSLALSVPPALLAATLL